MVQAIIGQEDVCVHRTGKVCKGVSGLSQTLVRLLQATPKISSGNTLIIEDDMLPSDINLTLLKNAIKIVPPDWELIRFDCWHMESFEFQWVNPIVAATDTYNVRGCNVSSRPCGKMFCGGTHSLLVRPSSVPKLAEMWSQKP